MSKAFLMQEDSNLRTIFVPNELLSSIRAGSGRELTLQSVSGGSNVTLSTVEAQKLQIGQTFASVRQITDSCWGIRNTLFNSVTPKPVWYDGLNEKFGTVKHYANDWIDNIAIAVTSTIPSSVIDFVPTYSASADAITAITQRSPGSLSSSDLNAVRDILTRVVTKVDSISANVDQYAKLENGKPTGRLVTWQKNMSDASLDLKSGSANIQSAASDLTTAIQGYNSEIDSLKSDIDYYNKLVATGAGLVCGGIFVGIVGAALCFAFPVVGGIVLAIGVAMLIGGAVTWGVYQKRINDANAKILEYKSKITESNHTLLALNTLSSSVDLAVSNAESAVKNLTNFASSWVTFGTSLKSTLASLQQGGEEAVGALVDLDMEIAKGYWLDVKDYATSLMNSPSDVKQVPASQVA